MNYKGVKAIELVTCTQQIVMKVKLEHMFITEGLYCYILAFILRTARRGCEAKLVYVFSCTS